MTIRSKAEIAQQLGAYYESLASVVLDAWSKWEGSQERQAWMFDRGRANYIFEYIAAGAVSRFGDDPRINIVRKDETLWFILDRNLVFRFKKADDSFISRNIPTQQAIAFHEDAPLFADLDRVEIVYLVNDLGTAIKDVCVVARAGRRVLWNISLLSEAGDNVVTLAPPPLPLPPGTPAPVHVKPKLFVVKGDGVTGKDNKNGSNESS